MTPPDCHDPLELLQAFAGLVRRLQWAEEMIRTLEAANLDLQERLRISEELTSFVVEKP